MESSYMFVAYYVRIDRFVNLETSELWKLLYVCSCL
jgi:hypothetical protein